MSQSTYEVRQTGQLGTIFVVIKDGDENTPSPIFLCRKDAQDYIKELSRTV
jgi:hypothetical protein